MPSLRDGDGEALSELGDMVAASMLRKQANQGMRQPQFGGIQSQLRLTDAKPLCKHGDNCWRLGPGHKWICAVCHPPTVQSFEVWPGSDG